MQHTVAVNNDPSGRVAFSSGLDTDAQRVQSSLAFEQLFYECRIASLERYMTFCVLFHVMASESCRPWLCYPWDIARSQSNLRVATTASPISAADVSDGGSGGHGGPSSEAKKMVMSFVANIRKMKVNF